MKGGYLVASVRPMVLEVSSLPVAGLPANRPFDRRFHFYINCPTFNAPTYMREVGGGPAAGGGLCGACSCTTAGSPSPTCSLSFISFFIMAAALTISSSPWTTSFSITSLPIPLTT